VAEVIIDTSVLIGYTRGDGSCRAIIDPSGPGRRRVTHAVCEAELLAGARDSRDLRLLVDFVAGFRVLIPTPSGLRESIMLLRAHGLRSGVDWHDCLVAATAKRLGAAVATMNVKHFACFRGLRVARVG